MKRLSPLLLLVLIAILGWTGSSIAQTPRANGPILLPGRVSSPADDWKFVNEALGYGSCRPPSVTQLMKETCARAIEESPLCKGIQAERRRDCETEFDPTESSLNGEKALGCLAGAGYAVGDIFKALNDFLVWYAMYFLDGGQTQRQFGAAASSELQSVGDYLAAEYALAYLQTPTSDSHIDRAAQATTVTVNTVSQKVWGQVDQFIGAQIAELDCLKPRERQKEVCRFFTAIAIPPVGLKLIATHGAKAIQYSAQLKGLLQTLKSDLRGRRVTELAQGSAADNVSELATARASGSSVASASAVPDATAAHALCEGCPVIHLTDGSLRHLERHFGRIDNWERVESRVARIGDLSEPEKIQLAQDVLPLSRTRIETSVFPGDLKIETVFRAIDKKVDGWIEIPNKQPGRKIMRGDIEVSRGSSVQTYQVEVAFCVEAKCTDALGQNFRQGDVISIQPNCGPGVVKVRRTPDIQGFIDGKNGFKRAAPAPVPCS